MIITSVDEPFLANDPLGLESLVIPGEQPRPGPGKMANGHRSTVADATVVPRTHVSYGQTGTDP